MFIALSLGMKEIERTAGAVTVAIWTYLLAARGRFWLIRETPPAASLTLPAPAVTVIIPARDEADVIGEAIKSLLSQRYPGTLRIVIVDDNSNDGTANAARIAAQTSANRERLHVLAGAPLPAGWTGKLWAVAQGIELAETDQPDFLLLTDADIVHEPDNISDLVSRAQSAQLDLVSLMVKLQCRTFAERSLIPAFVFFFFMLYPPRWIADPNKSTAGAAGGCILIRPGKLRQIGGIAAIRGALIDDCALARGVKDCNGRVWLGTTQHTRSIRNYLTFAEVGRMISRSAYTQLQYSVWLLAGSVCGLLITYAAPPALLFSRDFLAAALGATAWLGMSLAFLPVLTFYRLSPLWAPCLPAIALFYLGATLHSSYAHWRGKGGAWKGRIQSPRR